MNKKALIKNIIITLFGLSLIILTLNVFGNPTEFFKLHLGKSKSIGNIALGTIIGLFFFIVGLINIFKLIRDSKK